MFSQTVKQSAYLMLLKDEYGVCLTKTETGELPRLIHLRVTAARLAKLGDNRCAKQEDTNLKARPCQRLGSLKNW